VKQGADHHACLSYGIEYGTEEDISRVHKIYYNFELFKDGKAVGPAIANVFINTHGRFTNPRFYAAAMGNQMHYYNPYIKTSESKPQSQSQSQN
jgi:hypothetical protein